MSHDPGLSVKGCNGMQRCLDSGLWSRGIQSEARDKAGSLRALYNKILLKYQ